MAGFRATQVIGSYARRAEGAAAPARADAPARAARFASRFRDGTPVRANDFSQSWIEGPRMLPSMYASPGQREQLLPCAQVEQPCRSAIVIDRTSFNCGESCQMSMNFWSPHVAAGQRKLHARDRRRRTARRSRRCGRRCTAACRARPASASGPAGGAQNSSALPTSVGRGRPARAALGVDVEVEDRAVAVHHRRDRGVDVVVRAERSRERPHLGVVVGVVLHQHVGEAHLHAGRPEAAARPRSCAGTTRAAW